MKISCLRTDEDAISGLFRPFALKMEEQGLPPIVINVFKCYFTQLLQGAQGKLMESEISPVSDDEVQDYEALEQYEAAGREAMSEAVVIKLNGGLGTSMGLEQAKSLITVKDGFSFLDLILRQVERLREKHQAKIPLVLMNSFKTHMDSMLRSEGFDNGDTGIPLAFLQHKYPKIIEETYAPATWKANPDLEWNPPGHGDLYTALITSGLLSKLLERGYRWAFVSNSDNLGAVMDERILGLMASRELPFLMEVAVRTPSDRKGGHLARLRKTGRFVLREVAQCPSNEMDAFQDISRYRYFNTNSLWLDLRAMEEVFVYHQMMPLDIIINPKNLDPREPSSPKVLQVETAMGSAVSNFQNAAVVRVPRTRFAPVKTTNDLLLVKSDCYIRDADETVVPNPERGKPMPSVDLDPAFYKKIDEFEARFSQGAPSLLPCTSLAVKGDIRFEGDTVMEGDVQLENRSRKQVVLPAGEHVSGRKNLP